MTPANIIPLLELLVGGYEVFDKLIHFGAKADEIEQAVKAVLGMVKDGFEGSSTPDEVKARLAALHQSLQSPIDKAEADLHKRFNAP